MGFEPMNTGFADQRVSLFAIGASWSVSHYCEFSCETAELPPDCYQEGSINDPLL